MQEVIGALAGWANIVSGRIFRVGDRIQMGGVQGDVIDLTPLRTKILEFGTARTLGVAIFGGVVAGLAAYGSTALLMLLFRRREVEALGPFGYYCIAAGLAALVLLLAR